MKNIYITTKTPLRISFFGGGTDFENFYKNFSGNILSTSIDKYIYVTIKSQNQFFDENFRLNYSKTERVKKIDEIQNQIIKECLKYTNIKSRLYISTVSDIPDSTGLGSSSAFTVGLLKGLYKIKGFKKSNKELAKIASYIEINKVKSPIGKQDQLACSLGGFNNIIFNRNNTVKIKKIKNLKLLNEVFKYSALIWTGKYKKSKKILSDQQKNVKNNTKNLKKILQISYKTSKKISKNKFSFNEFKNNLKISWRLKKTLSKKISNPKINNIIKLFETKHFGFKLLGAGGGGFIFVVGKNNKKIIKNNKLITLKVKPENKGSEIIYEETK